MRVKTELKRQAILDVAGKVFLEMGYQRASMGEISARLGGSKATLYSYYDSKQALFFDFIQTTIAPLIEPAFSELTHGVDDVSKTLIAFGKQLMHTLCMPQFIAARRIVIAESDHTDIGERFYNDGPKKGHEKVVAFISAAIEAGKLRHTDANIASRHLHALLHAETLNQYIFCLNAEISPKLIDESVERAIEVFMSAYGLKSNLK